MIKLDLTIEEVNTILRSLGKHPFEEIAMLISKIKQQGEPQVAELVKQQEAAMAAQQAVKPEDVPPTPPAADTKVLTPPTA